MASNEQPFAGLTALVTGASRGIGREVAVSLARRGAALALVAKTTGGLEETDDLQRAVGGAKPAILVPLNLTEAQACDRLAAGLHQRWGRLDLLVGCAGAMPSLSPVTHQDPKAFDRVLALTLTANVRLLRALDPLFRAAPNPRGVFAWNGRVADGTKPFWGAYAAAQAGLASIVAMHGRESGGAGATLACVDPGATDTRLFRNAYPGADAAGLNTPAQAAETLVAALERL